MPNHDLQNGSQQSVEYDILKMIAENPEISQRKIAEANGISLGQANFLIKKFIKIGLIKIEGQTSKSIRYNITPRGLSEKARLTFRYIKISYEAVINLTDKIRELAKQYDLDGNKIIVYGPQDEMMQICKLALGENALYLNKLKDSNDAKKEIEELMQNELNKQNKQNKKDELNEFNQVIKYQEYIIFYWEEDPNIISKIHNVRAVNILL